MRKLSSISLSLATLFSATASLAATQAHHASHAHPGSSGASLRHTSAHVRRGAHSPVRHEAVRTMGTERATAIQTALIEKGYMTGEPTGTWDAASIAAMQKLQGDNGWQTKIMPDSRALIKLGLGPQQQQDTASLQ